MSRSRLIWVLGVATCVLAFLAALQIALVLPLGYDARAYWLAAQHFVEGRRLYPLPDAPLGQPDEYHYLPIVVLPFVALLPFPIGVAIRLFVVVELVLAAAVGYVLLRRLPFVLRPWAAAGYLFFLPLVLEVTLGNVDLASLALALLAWHWRDRAARAALPFAVAVGLKFLPAILLPFYVAAGRGRIVWRALAIGVGAVLITLPLLWRHTLDYLELIPRYTDTDWVRLHVERDEPALLAGILWSDAFPIVLSLVAFGCGIACGRMARRDPARETEWHHVALALAPYLAPFGFFWTTVLITSLPLFVVALARAIALRPVMRALVLVGLAGSWLLMQIVQVHDLLVPLYHLAGVVGLVGIALALLANERAQTLGRSIPRSRATSSASG